MKRNELVFRNDKHGYVRKCVLAPFEPWGRKEHRQVIDNIIETSANMDDVIQKIIDSKDLVGTQAWSAVLANERPDLVSDYLNKVFKHYGITTFSDAGGVRIAAPGAFSFIVPNGEGDGVTSVFVLPYSFNNFSLDDFFSYFTEIDGTFYALKNDIGPSEPAVSFSGRFHAYRGRFAKMVLFLAGGNDSEFEMKRE